MPLLNAADAVHLGSVKVDAVHLGPTRVWPSMPGPQTWFRADAITGLADGAPVGLWPASAGRNAVVLTGTAPVYRARGRNGRPSVSFPSGSGRMAMPGLGTVLSGLADYSVFVVCVSNAINTWPIVFTAPTGDGWEWVLEYDNSGGFYWGSRNGFYNCYATGFTSGTWACVSAVMTAGLPRFYKNGTQVVQTSFTGPNGVLSGLIPGLGPDVLIGNYYNGAMPLTGDIAEAMFYDHALSDAERLLVESYLREKYDL